MIGLGLIVFCVYWLQQPPLDISVILVSLGGEIWYSCVQILVIAGLMGFLAFYLQQAVTRSTNLTTDLTFPLLSTIWFGVIIGAVHFPFGVPIIFMAIVASPVIFLPPLTYCVTKPTISEQSPKPLFSPEETCRLKDNLTLPSLVREFRERYPDAKAYVYKKDSNHSAGGLFLHNRERLPIPSPTYIEVTLDCPFTHKAGNFAYGREAFRAYLSRHREHGSIVEDLPQQDWEKWLLGLESNEWFKRIERLNEKRPTHPNLGHLPYQLFDKITNWEPITLL